MSIPLHRNGYVKIVLSFVIMGLAPTLHSYWMTPVQFVAGALYFAFGLKLVLDQRNGRST